MKIYSKPVKIVALLILIISIAVAGVFSTFASLAITLGCYSEGDKWYDSYIVSNAQYNDAYMADNWYEHYEKQQAGTINFSEQQYLNSLTEDLQNSSIGLIRVDSQGNKTPIAGFNYVENSGINEYQKISDFVFSDEYYYEMYFNPNSGINDNYTRAYDNFNKLLPNCYNYLAYIGISAVVGFIAYIILLVGSARNSKTGEIEVKYIHKIPFDVLTFIIFPVFIVLLAILFEEICYNLDEVLYFIYGSAVSCIIGIFVICLAWFHTFVARIKAKTLIKSTLCYKILRWLFNKIKNIFLKLKNNTDTKKNNVNTKNSDINFDIKDKKINLNEFYEKCSNNLKSADIKGKADTLYNNITNGMSITAKIYLLFIPFILLFELLLVLIINSLFLGFIFLVLDVFIFIKINKLCIHLNEIKNAGEHLAHGDLDYKISVDTFKGELLNHAENLNKISDGMTVAVEERLKSERMRYELLTNVSHDIKTPLTSIINYVDLLKSQPVSTKEAEEYIEVLDRQSVKLKKLITDLIEVSKATTGNITVNAVQMEVKELLAQCIGEYDSRFKEKKLQIVMNTPDEPVSIVADGRLLWRVFDNLLGNIVKYAMPNTRVYIDLTNKLDTVIITLKNISQTRLNIKANELMERFVRGDASRTTEGSGLGLSIAQSLTELMKGQFSIEIDGDLFKITLKFNK